MGFAPLRHAAMLVLPVIVSCAAGAAAQIPTLEPLDATGRITYFVSDGSPESGYLAGDRDLALWALRTWERTIGGALRFEIAPESEAQLQIQFVGAAGGQYGEMRSIVVNGRRGAAVFVRPDVRALGPDIARTAADDPLMRDTIVYLTCLHELGHAMGLTHTEAYADIMYFFGYGGDIPGFFTRYRRQLRTRADIQNVSGLSATDVSRVRALYGK